MEISENYITRNQRSLLRIYSNLQRQSNELSNLGLDEICNKIMDGMDDLEELLLSAGIEAYPEDHDEKLAEAWSWLCDMYKAVGQEVNGEKRIYRVKLREHLKALGWKNHAIGNAFRDEPSRPMARLMDAGYIKVHGQLYWSIHKEVM